MRLYFIAALFALTVCLCVMQSSPLFSENAAAALDNIPSGATAYGAANIRDGWSRIDTEHFAVYCEDGVDLNMVARRLRKRIFLFGEGPSYEESAEKNIAYRLDSLFSRARDILDMHPQMPKIKIRIFSEEDKLYREYRKMTGNSFGGKAFYIHFYRTIFTSAGTITDSVMAHEIAHAIIDHYYKSVPSTRVGEALASYIDLHISD